MAPPPGAQVVQGSLNRGSIVGGPVASCANPFSVDALDTPI